jgi:tetratricopeptide (TPR) repeat protein
MSFFGSQKIDGIELQECLSYFEALNKVLAFQDKETDLFNNAMIEYGNSIEDHPGARVANDMKRAINRLEQAATEIIKRHEKIRNVPNAASTMHSAWLESFSANALWASAMVEAIESSPYALLDMASGMTPQIEYAEQLAREHQKRFGRAQDEYEKLLNRMKVSEEVKDTITAHATTIDDTDAWEPKTEPDNTTTHLDLAFTYEDEGRYYEAIMEYQESIRLEPRAAADAHFRMGIIYRDFLDKPDDAIREFKEAINIDPNDNAAHDCLALVYKQQGRLIDAIKEYKEASRIYPDDDGNYESLGEIYHELGKLDDAIREFKEVIRLNPESASAYYELGDIYSNLGNFKEALEHYQKFNRLAPTMPFYAPFVEEVNNKIQQLKKNI